MTVLEILTVIIVVALLAALGVGLVRLANRMSIEHRVRAELNQLSVAIEAYKAHFGFYPPDNPRNAVTNQLYYELTGALFKGRAFRSMDGGEDIPQQVLERLFNANTIANSAREVNEIKNFIQLKPSQHPTVYTNPNVQLLAVPVNWPTNKAHFPPPLPPVVGWVNPWRYVSTKPTNNPASFDLWAEVVIGNDRRVIANWKQ